LLPFLTAGTQQISAEGQAARDREKLVQAFIERLSIEPVRKTQLVSIVFEAQDPKLAAEVANAIGEAYIDGQLAAKMGIT
ncbi:hypothetical protein M3M33_16845, partial [Loigolactobacillus coryniformis]|nr:hypothetical protein [Loigolactobacillus coryniformis]